MKTTASLCSLLLAVCTIHAADLAPVLRTPFTTNTPTATSNIVAAIAGTATNQLKLDMLAGNNVWTGTSNHWTGDVGFDSFYATTVTAGTINGNGNVLTNLNGNNIVSSTNLMGFTVDFSKTETTTVASSNLTFSALSNVNGSVYNWQIIHFMASGADRSASFPASWINLSPSSGTCVATNGSMKDILIQLQPNVFTNYAFH